MRILYLHSLIFGFVLNLNQVNARGNRVVVSSDGPVILGGNITFRADLYLGDGSRPSGTFSYSWMDNALIQHKYETDATTNTTNLWTISYPPEHYSVGPYRIDVTVTEKEGYIFWPVFSRNLTVVDVTNFLNGDIKIQQSNKTLGNEFVSSETTANMSIDLRKGDLDYVLKKATSILTFWFVDCKYYGYTSNFKFDYNFNQPNTSHHLEALVVASFDPPVNVTTITPITDATITSTTTANPNNTTPLPSATTEKPKIVNPVTEISYNDTTNTMLGNTTFPFVCRNSSVIPPEPNKTYGYFTRKIEVRAPITAIKVDGSNWLQPWEELSLNISCDGTGPFNKCLLFYPGHYNVTGNETCKEMETLNSCGFPIIHYFLDPDIYTIVVILQNDISKQVSPITVTIYKATPKSQLSVIIVPVSCSLIAAVLIVFGVASYIQSRARFTVEVADFDFGQHNPEMEYKTFRERLRDSFNSALRPGTDRISGYEPLNKPLLK